MLPGAYPAAVGPLPPPPPPAKGRSSRAPGPSDVEAASRIDDEESGREESVSARQQLAPPPLPLPLSHRSSRAPGADSASRQDQESLGAPPDTPTSGSAEQSLTDVESVSLTEVDPETQSSATEDLEDRAPPAIAEQVLSQRWQCDLCFEWHSSRETLWRLNDARCGHTFCQGCIRGSIQWGGRCPYDDAAIPAVIVCGVMGTDEYTYHEKYKEAQRTRGIMCTVSHCPGVARAAEGHPARPVACGYCKTRHCGRRVCGAPWSEGHRCWDLIEEDLMGNEQDLETLDANLATTRRRLTRGPRFRPCPQCHVMVERTDGCNMVYHDMCRTRWCFICRRIGTCSDYDCRAPSSGPPTPRRRREPPGSGPPTPRSFGPTAAPPTNLVKATRLCVAIAMASVAIYSCIIPRGGVQRIGFLNTTEPGSPSLNVVRHPARPGSPADEPSELLDLNRSTAELVRPSGQVEIISDEPTIFPSERDKQNVEPAVGIESSRTAVASDDPSGPADEAATKASTTIACTVACPPAVEVVALDNAEDMTDLMQSQPTTSIPPCHAETAEGACDHGGEVAAAPREMAAGAAAAITLSINTKAATPEAAGAAEGGSLSVSMALAGDEEGAEVPEFIEDKEKVLWEWLSSLDRGVGALLQYFEVIRQEFEADFTQIAAARLPEPISPGTIGSIDPTFFEVVGVKPLGHRLLLAKGILELP
eukprot:gnl/TRDRNA2_/TRDRNA2_33794_c0_seq1.p1 gnl/TRDRNA2_/TRDRNA2_33794_c0~~gnl/TRDRNA2_/TRDRNA2_33794_c0_seq1.p1  ORF type:complete len:715 (+),score=92.32 gnl/TRDRNA2_/TRDRNA2_33794_c0_seq1:35-2146(+)